jgi:valine--pyruvate aminotransferase
VIAKPEIITAIGALNSIVALASGSMGQALGESMLRSGELKTLADTAVQPFYRDRLNRAKEVMIEAFGDRPWRMHRSEGALFLWLYLEKLSVPATELYSRLKERGVIVVPGEYFFFGRDDGTDEEVAWKNHPHREKCLRINYSGDPELVHEGLRILAEVSAELEP